MASSHVPKFGNWERENVPYTTYFENARRDRGAKIINPNDPEQNPDAFITVGRTSSTHESETRQKLQHTENSREAVGAPPKLPIGSKSEYMLEQQQQQQQHMKKHLDMGRGGASFNDDLEASTHQAYSHHQRVVVDNNSQVSRRNHHESRSSSSSHSGSDKTSSDYSLLKSHHHLHVHEGGNSSSGQAIFMKSGNARRDEVPQRVASVPKFGAWDETDPRSGEGFTAIFNKVKEEKQIAAAKFPQVPVGQTVGQTGHGGRDSAGLKSKICCCLFSRGDK
eukprot:TRINITY_DN3805_c1_g1_i1.p1 TRINITY_DN3805_c1_g1~~TRINITY_DN3805_c1_g1_i1.p1  ORF type:complete len:279 (+),score=59.14 TRINITY_DN3805_c1_g1_i1:319-1155(+)